MSTRCLPRTDQRQHDTSYVFGEARETTGPVEKVPPVKVAIVDTSRLELGVERHGVH